MPGARIFLENQASDFEQFVAMKPDLRVTPAQARYLVEFLRRPPTELIRNVGPIRTSVAAVGDAVIPLVINDGNASDCYLVSPYVHYIAYMKLEVRKMRPLWTTCMIRACLTVMGVFARRLRFDRFVSINNWLFTTSMTNDLSDEEVRGLKGLLREQFPDHAWVYREFKASNKALAEALSRNGFRRLIHRPVFEWDPQWHRERRFKRKTRLQIQRDLSLTEGHPYSVRCVGEGTSTDLVAQFYADLYIHKHSRFNAHFTSAYFDTVLATGINRLSFVELGGRAVGFLTTCMDGDRLIASLVGYDQSIDRRRASPYRAAVGEAFRQSLASGRCLFLSTGVAAFKNGRGAYESMVYEAFEVSHLSLYRRLPWHLMKRFLEALLGRMDTGAI
jgi:Acetyltransferase (GNAT) domain